MNSLSWMLYWADVAPGLAGALGFVFFILTVIAAAITIGCTAHGNSRYTDEGTAKACKRGAFFAGPLAFLFLMISLSSNLIPSKQTIYLIAASEMGEASVKQFTPELTKIRGVVNKYLDSALDEDSDKDK